MQRFPEREKPMTTTNRSRPPAKAEKDTRGERTRKKIKKTIARIVRRKDVTEFTLADICQSAEITTGAFYFHFKSKEEAIEEMVADESHELYQSVLKGTSTDNLNLFLRDLVSHITAFHHTQKKLPRAMQVTINSSPAAHDAWINARRPLVDKMEKLISDARRSKRLSVESSRYLAYYLLNAVEDLGMDAFQWNNPTIKRFAADPAEWNRKQIALWSWAVLAPI